MIGVIDYKMGNIKSVTNALGVLGENFLVVSHPKDLAGVQAIILPGVGAFAKGMENLKKAGFLEVLNEEVLAKKKPYLGICLGLQFLADKSYEHGEFEGFGWIKGEVRLINTEKALKIPHMGWNNIEVVKDGGLLQGLQDNPVFYFVHSYVLDAVEKDVITSTCQYGEKFVASLQKDNIFGAQFHPEKSQAAGLKFLSNFIKIVDRSIC